MSRIPFDCKGLATAKNQNKLSAEGGRTGGEEAAALWQWRFVLLRTRLL